MSIKNAILAVSFAREYRSVSVPQWAGTEGKLRVQSLNALEDERYERLVESMGNGNTSAAAEITALVLVDEEGRRVFTTPEEVQQLGQGDPDPLNAVWFAYSQLRKEQREKKRAALTTTHGST